MSVTLEPFVKRIQQLQDLRTMKSGKDKLILLGDYIDVGRHSKEVLQLIYDLQKEVGPENMIVLMGNHDRWFLDFLEGKNDQWIEDISCKITLESFLGEDLKTIMQEINATETSGAITDTFRRMVLQYMKTNYGELYKWYRKLPPYYRTDTQIFVHAGVDEEAEDWWDTGTPDEMLLEKYPPQFGSFYMDIIAGHVSTSSVSENREQHDIYYDGASHFYIDGIDSYPQGTAEEDRVIPLLLCKTERGENKYYALQEDGSRDNLKK